MDFELHDYVTFDIEVIPNCFTCAFYSINNKKEVTCEISDRKCEIAKLFRIFLKNDRTFVGYNCSGYDTPIVNMLFDKYYIDEDDYNYEYVKHMFIRSAYSLSSDIIHRDGGPKFYDYKKMKFFESIDLMTLNFSSMQRVGLKELQVTMKYHNVEEMEVDWNQPISEDRIDNLLHYNVNDVLSTAEFFELSKPQLEVRKFAKEKYGIACESMDAVTLCVNYVANEYCRLSGIKKYNFLKTKHTCEPFNVSDILLPHISFKTEKCNKVFEWFKSKKYIPGQMKDDSKSNHYVLLLDGKGYKFGFGGLHAMPKPSIWRKNNNGLIYRQSDVKLLAS